MKRKFLIRFYYFLGHVVWKLIEWNDWRWLYPCYNSLMLRSFWLDHECRFWKKVEV